MFTIIGMSDLGFPVAKLATEYDTDLVTGAITFRAPRGRKRLRAPRSCVVVDGDRVAEFHGTVWEEKDSVETTRFPAFDPNWDLVIAGYRAAYAVGSR